MLWHLWNLMFTFSGFADEHTVIRIPLEHTHFPSAAALALRL